MTGQLSAGIAGSDRELEQLNNAFFEFAKSHRRQNLINRISKDDDDDHSKSTHFYKLFSIQHITPEEQNSLADITDLKVLQKLLKYEKKALGKDYWEHRKIDHSRCRLADLTFDIERRVNAKKPVRMQPDELENHNIFATPKSRNKYVENIAQMKRSSSRTFLPKLESIQTSGDIMKRRIKATKLIRQVGRYDTYISNIPALHTIHYCHEDSQTSLTHCFYTIYAETCSGKVLVLRRWASESR